MRSMKLRKNRILEILFAAAVIVLLAAVMKADKGYCAECGEAPGYLGAVTVFDKGGEPVYKWYSARGYIINADVSDSGKYLAVACEEAGRGKVHIFRLDSTEEAGLFDSDEIVVGVGYLGNKLCALTEHGAYMVTAKGNVKKHVRFGGYLGEYEFSDGELTAELREYLSGGTLKEIKLG